MVTVDSFRHVIEQGKGQGSHRHVSARDTLEFSDSYPFMIVPFRSEHASQKSHDETCGGDGLPGCAIQDYCLQGMRLRMRPVSDCTSPDSICSYLPSNGEPVRRQIGVM